jgi:hypothetical protein
MKGIGLQINPEHFNTFKQKPPGIGIAEKHSNPYLSVADGLIKQGRLKRLMNNLIRPSVGVSPVS